MRLQTESIDKMTKAICKLKCISHFIETQDPEYLKPIDYGDIQYGLSLIIDEIQNEFLEIKIKLESE